MADIDFEQPILCIAMCLITSLGCGGASPTTAHTPNASSESSASSSVNPSNDKGETVSHESRPPRGKGTKCDREQQAFLDAATYAGMFRLGDLQGQALAACKGQQDALERVNASYASTLDSLSDPCRAAQAALDNNWYRRMAQGTRQLNAQGIGRQSRAIAALESACSKMIVSKSRERWPEVFAALDARKQAKAQAEQKRLADLKQAEAAREEQRVKPLKVKEVREAFEKLDGKKLETWLGRFLGPRIGLDNGKSVGREQIIECFNVVKAYRDERSSCGSPSWMKASCPQNVLNNGKWLGATNWIDWHKDGSKGPVFEKANCGFAFEAFNESVKTDVAMVARYERRVDLFERERSLARSKRRAFENQATATATADKAVVRAGISDSVCSAYRNLELLEKQKKMQRRIDRESGTTNLTMRRKIGTATVVITDQAKIAIQRYIQAGGKRGHSKKRGTKFWCAQPSYSSLLAAKQKAALTALMKKNSMSAKRLCAAADWKQLADAVKNSYFSTCAYEDEGGDMRTMPQPLWDWLAKARKTGEDFMYAYDLADSAAVVVLRYSAGAWKLVRSESCPYGGGSKCDDPSEFSVD